MNKLFIFSYLILINSLFAQVDEKEEIQRLLSLLHNGKNQEVEEKLIKMEKSITPHLIEYINNNLSRSLISQFDILSKVANKKDILPLLDILDQTTRSWRRFQILDVIVATSKRKDITPELFEALQTKNYRAKICGIETLERIFLFKYHREIRFHNIESEDFSKTSEIPMSIITELENMLSDPHQLVRKEARRVISKMYYSPNCGTINLYYAFLLAEKLRDKTSISREKIAFLLSHMMTQSSELTKILKEFAQDETPAVRMQIVRGFRKLNAIPELKKAMEDVDIGIRIYAQKSIDEIRDRNIQILEIGKETYRINQALEILTEVGNYAAISYVEKWLYHQDKEIRKNAKLCISTIEKRY